jgi:glycine/D-amino acid oxidase-like deaminating enzyme
MAAFTPSKVVICGAGLHGCALAYYLTKAGHTDVTVVEQHGVACAASGKGGGFLARDWGSGATTQLHQASFALHEDLARELGIESYRRIQVTTGESQQQQEWGVPLASGWREGGFGDSGQL